MKLVPIEAIATPNGKMVRYAVGPSDARANATAQIAASLIEIEQRLNRLTLRYVHDGSPDADSHSHYITEQDAARIIALAGTVLGNITAGASNTDDMRAIAQALDISLAALLTTNRRYQEGDFPSRLPLFVPERKDAWCYYVDIDINNDIEKMAGKIPTTCRKQLAADLASESGLYIAMVEKLIHETLHALPAQGVGYFPLPGRLNGAGVAFLREHVLDFVKGTKPCASYKIRDISDDLQRTLAIGTNNTWLLSQQLAENCEIVLFDIDGEAYTNRGGDELLRQKAAEFMRDLEAARSTEVDKLTALAKKVAEPPTAADVMAGDRDALRALYPNATEFGLAALADMLVNDAWKKALLEAEQQVGVIVSISFGTELPF